MAAVHGHGQWPWPMAIAVAKTSCHKLPFDIRKVILGGGQAVGKSMLMPPNPDLKAQPAVLRALLEKVRGFGPKSDAILQAPKAP